MTITARAADLCKCGKPAEHVNADPDSQEWSCRVPLPDAAEFAAKAPAIDHAIAIETVRLPAGNPLRALCVCGWASEFVPSRPKAVEVGERHMTLSRTGSLLLDGEIERQTAGFTPEEMDEVWAAGHKAMVEHASRLTRSSSERLPAVQCQPWCWRGDGHPQEFCREDQWCGTEEVTVGPLAMHTDPNPGYGDRDNSVLVYGAAGPVVPLHVVIAHDGTDALPYFTLRMTPEEASQLIDRLGMVLALIDPE